jgi:hypothetical protein
VTAWAVRSPVAFTDTRLFVDGRSMGSVSLKVAVGNVDVSMIRWWNWLSRRVSSLDTCVRSTVTSDVGTGDGEDRHHHDADDEPPLPPAYACHRLGG